ncbi:hypothetical protein JX266_007190 [Neoarthrinium moseri]|nr:hypothetical protein JX266_007190 [Neoarthrinium moseri]
MPKKRKAPPSARSAAGPGISTSPTPISMSTAPTTSGPEPLPDKATAPLYFWRESHAGTGFLSQWHSGHAFLDPRDAERKVYATAEHYMMHHKALLFGDADAAAAVLKTGHPRKVKALGRAVQGFSEEAWGRERGRVVERANYCKFTFPAADPSSEEGEEAGGGREWRLGTGATAKTMQAASFRAALLATGEHELVEASPYDRIWGVGFAAADADANREHWGENLLGKALMVVRETFRREDAEEAERKRDRSKDGDEADRED